MEKPALPVDEAQRLSALRALALLDTPAEESFDRITRIARQVFGVPITLVSLVDAERQWFKSKQGLDATETSREISFCGHAILGAEVFEVPNALEDARFADNPLVTGPPSIRFYAATPLSTPEGYRVGTLCLIDRAPRRLSVEEQHLLRDLGDLVEIELGRMHLNAAVTALRDQEERLRAVFDTVNDGIVTIGADGVVDSYNPAAAAIFGYTATEVIGRNVSMLMPEPYRGEHDGYIRHYLDTGEARVIGQHREVTGRRKDGSTFPLELSISESTVGGGRLFTGVVRDLSAQQQAERMKKEFVSTISHELRTPLTSIRGSLGLIAGGVAGPLPESAAKLIEVAHRNSERLVRLINDILDIDKIASGKMRFDMAWLSVSPLVLGALEANRAYAREYGVDLDLTGAELDARIHVDADRLAQVLANLISNAAKFSPRGDTVEVALSKRNGRARVGVTDHGPGIPPEFQAHIFEKFSQADSSDTRQKGGTGLGLAITRSLVEAMGGRIGFDSVPGHTEFWVEFPATFPEAPEAPPDARPRVLVCEDDPDVAALIRYMLEGDGFHADIALDAETAKSLLEAGDYAAMTLDIALPGEDGIALIRELRASEAHRDLPIVVVSAFARAGNALLGASMAVEDWLEKPIDRERLLKALHSGTVHGSEGATSLLTHLDGVQRILHVEDDPDVFGFVSTLTAGLAELDHAPDLDTARQLLRARQYDLVILDLGLPDGSGWDLLPLLSERALEAKVVVFSASNLSHADAQHFAASLVKANTDNATLLATIKRHIGTPAPQRSTS